MKWFMLFVLACLTFSSNAQRLVKPKKDKKTGVTVTRTESTRITVNKTKILFGRTYSPVDVIVAKTDTNSMYLHFSGETGGYRFKMQEGDSLKLSLGDGGVLWLTCHHDSETNSVRMPEGGYVSYWSNDYILDPVSRDILRKNDVLNIGVSSHDKKYNFSYDTDPKKRDFIKKAVILVEKS